VWSVMIAGVGTGAMAEAYVLACLSSLRRHQRAGQRSPHKSLLVLYALGQLAATGSSAVAWPAAAAAEFLDGRRSDRVEPAMCVLRFRRPTRRGQCWDRGGACSLVQLRRA
jgi:hypothetical protein